MLFLYFSQKLTFFGGQTRFFFWSLRCFCFCRKEEANYVFSASDFFFIWREDCALLFPSKIRGCIAIFIRYWSSRNIYEVTQVSGFLSPKMRVWDCVTSPPISLGNQATWDHLLARSAAGDYSGDKRSGKHGEQQLKTKQDHGNKEWELSSILKFYFESVAQ